MMLGSQDTYKLLTDIYNKKYTYTKHASHLVSGCVCLAALAQLRLS
jgi:hypothetical protein